TRDEIKKEADKIIKSDETIKRSEKILEKGFAYDFGTGKEVPLNKVKGSAASFERSFALFDRPITSPGSFRFGDVVVKPKNQAEKKFLQNLKKFDTRSGKRDRFLNRFLETYN